MGRMKFGLFMAPHHATDEDPTLAFDRDLELVQWLDALGYDEAYVGEHHSAGWETISSPEVFIATAAERTRHIRLGTGVVSLPYHHPFIVADRMVLLDHLTKGRVIFGVGPGGLISDALMMGIDPKRQREMMDEALGVILRLFRETEPFTYKSDWFQLNEAMLQIRPYTQPHMPVAVASIYSPSGVQVAGKYGVAVLSMGVRRQGAVEQIPLAEMWSIAEESAAKHGQTVRRDDWRVAIPVHLAESRKEALEDVRLKATRYLKEYSYGILGNPLPDIPLDQIVEYMVEGNEWIVGTPDDCIAGIKQLQNITGGFGGLLIRSQEWTTREKILHSYELFSRYVKPQFQGALAGISASKRLMANKSQELHEAHVAALERAKGAYSRRH